MHAPAFSRQQVRELDRIATEQYGIPGVVLMENACRGAAEVLMKLGVQGPVHIVCGKGNNGGDGYVIARHLDMHRIQVIIHRCCEETEILGDALAQYRILKQSGLLIVPFSTSQELSHQLSQTSWVVDALLGTGLTGNVRPPSDGIIRCINQCGSKVLAVDLPSGMDADTGESLGVTVRANHTVTFVAPKLGFLNPAVHQWTGEVHVAQIGAPRVLLNSFGLSL